MQSTSTKRTIRPSVNLRSLPSSAVVLRNHQTSVLSGSLIRGVVYSEKGLPDRNEPTRIGITGNDPSHGNGSREQTNEEQIVHLDNRMRNLQGEYLILFCLFDLTIESIHFHSLCKIARASLIFMVVSRHHHHHHPHRCRRRYHHHHHHLDLVEDHGNRHPASKKYHLEYCIHSSSIHTSSHM
jgi:hypothetical protein